MKTDFNVSLINEDILEIYVLSENEEVDKLNLTWKVISFEEDSLIIKLKFLNPQYISTGFSYDNLVIHFKSVQQYFISKEYLIDLSKEYRTLS